VNKVNITKQQNNKTTKQQNNKMRAKVNKINILADATISLLLLTALIAHAHAQTPTSYGDNDYGNDVLTDDDDVSSRCQGGAWCDASLYFDRILSDDSSQVIHLDAVFSQFENGWGVANPGYYFELKSLPKERKGDGELSDVNDAGEPIGSAIATLPHRVQNAQGLVHWQPHEAVEDHSMVIEFEVVSDNDRKRCKLVVDRFGVCNSVVELKDSQGNIVFSPPVPTARIHYESRTTRFTLSVDAAYVHDDASYLIDFDDFSARTDSWRAMSSCANHQNLPSDAELPFRWLWQSAPTASFPHALDGSFLAYPSVDNWAQRAGDTTGDAELCGSVHYNTSYSFSELVACERRDGSTAVALGTDVERGLLMYSGNLYVNALAPIDKRREHWGFAKFRHVFPFEFGFKQRVSAVIGVPTEQALRVFVRSAEIDSDGRLKLAVETHYAQPSGLMESAVFRNGVTSRIASVHGDGPCTHGGQLCVQQWKYEAEQWAEQDNGQFRFTWRVVIDGHGVGVDITLYQALQEVQSETGLAIGELKLRVFDQLADMSLGENEVDLESRIFDPRERMFLRADLIVPQADQLNFGLRLLNVWVCFSEIEGYQIEYIEGQKNGCLDPFIRDTERFQLLDEGALTGGPLDVTIEEFAAELPTLIAEWRNPLGPSAAISFLATPQLPVGRTYTIHIEAEISQLAPTAPLQSSSTAEKRSTDDDRQQEHTQYDGIPITAIQGGTIDHRRSIHFALQGHRLRADDGDSQSTALSFQVAAREDGDLNEDDGHKSTSLPIIIGSATVGIAAVAFVAFFTWRRYRRRRNGVFIDTEDDNDALVTQDLDDEPEQADTAISMTELASA
jgi:hypothetical protein